MREFWRNLSVKKSSIYLLITGFAGFIYSFILLPYYTLGDQESYIFLYQEIQNYSGWEEKFKFYKNSILAFEPVYLFLVNLSSYFFNKNFAFSVLNGLLITLLVSWFLKRKVSLFIIFALIPNFYLAVILFSTERLKLGLLLFLMSLSFSGKFRWVLLMLALLSHFQLLILILVLFVWEYDTGKYNGVDLKIFLVVVFGAILLVFYSDQFSSVYIYLFEKLLVYSDSGGVQGMFKTIIFMIIALWYANRRVRTFIAFMPILLASYIVGPERITIFAYLLMMTITMQKHHGLNVGTIFPTIYFSFNGILFINNFIQYGTGNPL